jgi:hypothetical protein
MGSVETNIKAEFRYDNLWHESLILDGKHDLVVLCKRLHLDFHAWAERLRVQPNAGMLVLYQRDLQLYGKKRPSIHKLKRDCALCHLKPKRKISLTGALPRSLGFLSHRQLLCFTFSCLTSITIVLSCRYERYCSKTIRHQTQGLHIYDL